MKTRKTYKKTKKRPKKSILIIIILNRKIIVCVCVFASALSGILNCIILVQYIKLLLLYNIYSMCTCRLLYRSVTINHHHEYTHTCSVWWYQTNTHTHTRIRYIKQEIWFARKTLEKYTNKFSIFGGFFFNSRMWNTYTQH